MIGRALLALLVAGSVPAGAASAPNVSVDRLDCGQFDVADYEGKGPLVMTVSCYLIRHGDELVLFDAGLTDRLIGHTQVTPEQTISLDKSLAFQIAQMGVDPARVGTLVVSHSHLDHHGQAGSVPNARLFIGAADFASLKESDRTNSIDPWLKGYRDVEQVDADRDLFGDGSIVILFTPGHTPGHLSMLVRTDKGNLILTGDAVHTREQLATRRPPDNHLDKERGLKEIDRLIALAAKEHARIVVGHDPRDIDLLAAETSKAR